MKAPWLIRPRCALLVALGLVGVAFPASAKIIGTRSSSSATAPDRITSLLSPLYSIVIGSGIEFQTDKEQSEYGFPMLIEYSYSERLKLTLEPKYVSIVGKTPEVRSIRGFGDLESSVDYEFLRERRYRPALSAEGKIKWPTAAHPDLGDPGFDYTLGLIASKDLVFMEVDLNVLYTFAGNREREDEVEVSVAAEWPLSHYLNVSLIAEVANVTRVGRLRSGSRNEIEGTIGLGWQVSKFLRFEQGFVLKERGAWEVIFAWEWSFGGD